VVALVGGALRGHSENTEEVPRHPRLRTGLAHREYRFEEDEQKLMNAGSSEWLEG